MLDFDIEGAFNQWTAISVGLIIGGFIGKKLGVQRSGMLSSIGKKLLLPAAITGSLGLKNNNPDNGSKHSPYFMNSGSRQLTNIQAITVSSKNNSPSLW